MSQMAMTLQYTVDLDAPVHGKLQIPLVQGDRLSLELVLAVHKVGKKIDLTGVNCVGYVILSNELTVFIEGKIAGDQASIVLPAACYSVSGRIHILVRLYTTLEQYTPLYLVGNVVPGATNSFLDPDGAIPSIEELLSKIADMETATAAGLEATAKTAAAADAAQGAAVEAGAAAERANEAAERADEAAGAAKTAGAKWDRLSLGIEMIPSDGTPEGQITQTADSTDFHLQIPQPAIINATLYLDDATMTLYQLLPNAPQPSIDWAGNPHTTMLYMLVHGY